MGQVGAIDAGHSDGATGAHFKELWNVVEERKDDDGTDIEETIETLK